MTEIMASNLRGTVMSRLVSLCILSAILATAAPAWAASTTVNGSAALALAGVVAPNAPDLSTADKKEVAAFFDGNTSTSYKTKITVTADKIVCRVSNVDITARSCELTFGKTVKKLTGRAANEIDATEAMAGVPSDGAAGSIFEGLSKLSCTLDPAALKDKGGGGASCSYEPAN
jgi:hypothetical protein